MRRVIAVMAMPDDAVLAARVAEAVERFIALVRRDFFKIRTETARQAIDTNQISFDFAYGQM